ncbi:MAG: hypothetical protein U0838_13045 [Chloroflexota bacterium]
MAAGDLVTIDALHRQVAGLADGQEDVWLAGVVSAVSGAMEAAAGRLLAPRGSTTLLFSSEHIRDCGRCLRIRRGVSAVSYLGVADADQPDDGSGAYTALASGWYLRPSPQDRVWDGAGATSIELGMSAPRSLPTAEGFNLVKVVGSPGPSAVRPRDAQIAAAAVVRAWRAKSSGGADYAVLGPDGGMKILRDLAPAELAELEAAYRVPAVG